MYFDIHSHHFSDQSDIVQIMNVMPDDKIEVGKLGLFSCGMHPWYIPNDINVNQLERWLVEMISMPNLVAIGECGLDKLRGPDLALQEDVFRLHVKISEEHGKPVIIHSVKSLNEIMQLRRTLQPNQPWILHGCNANAQAIEQCAKLDFYFSLNRNCLRKNDLKNWLSLIPINRLFLESDDSISSLKDLYLQVSDVLDIPESDLREVIAQNVKTVFGSISYCK